MCAGLDCRTAANQSAFDWIFDFTLADDFIGVDAEIGLPFDEESGVPLSQS